MYIRILFHFLLFLFPYYYCLLNIELSFSCCDAQISPFEVLIKEFWYWLDHLLYMLLSCAQIQKKCFSKGNGAFIWLPAAKTWESQRTRNEVAEQAFFVLFWLCAPSNRIYILCV